MPSNTAKTVSPRVIQVRSGIPIEDTKSKSEYSDDLLFSPITRVEWDAIVSAGRNPMEWYDRLPEEQRRLPEGLAQEGAGGRFRVSPGVTVIYP